MVCHRSPPGKDIHFGSIHTICVTLCVTVFVYFAIYCCIAITDSTSSSQTGYLLGLQQVVKYWVKLLIGSTAQYWSVLGG